VSASLTVPLLCGCRCYCRRSRSSCSRRYCATLAAAQLALHSPCLPHSPPRYDALVLSPGAFAIKPPLPGIDLPGIFQMKTIPDT